MPERPIDLVERDPLAAMVEAITTAEVMQTGATFVVENGTVTIQFRWVGIVLALAQEIVGNAALYDWLRGLGPTVEVGGETVQKPWLDLTNQEKLDMVFAAAQRLIVAQAKTAYINVAQDAAKDTATTYADEEYILD